MSDSALLMTWGQAVRGREKRANDQLRASVRYWERLREEGRIERFEWGMLRPQGADVWGFALLRGRMEQIEALRGDAEFGQWVLRVALVADDVRVIDATVDEALLEQTMRMYDETIEGLD